MTKLRRWEIAFTKEAWRHPCGWALVIEQGFYDRDVLHFYDVLENRDVTLCTDGKTIGFHSVQSCPFVATP